MTADQTDKDVKFIRALADLLEESNLGEIEVGRKYADEDELTIRLSRTPSGAMQMPVAPAAVAPAIAPQPALVPAAAAVAEPAPSVSAAPSEGTVPSPMVGTVYLSPEPGAPSFVSVGSSVTEGQTLLIVEAMKTMNQIAAPRSGKIAEIFVADAEPVEFGTPLLVIV